MTNGAFNAAHITTRIPAKWFPFGNNFKRRFPVTSSAMFSAIPQKNRAAATTYFDEHLSHNDYYAQGEVLAHDQGGHWIGIGAEQLGLQPGEAVAREAFLRLCDNLHPTTGEQLTPQQFRERRLYFDFVCSPPKSVSILAVMMNDHRIIEAHQEASTMALRELEQFAATRIRKAAIRRSGSHHWQLGWRSVPAYDFPRPGPATAHAFRPVQLHLGQVREAVEGAANRRYVRCAQLRHGRLSQRTGQAAPPARATAPGRPPMGSRSRASRLS